MCVCVHLDKMERLRVRQIDKKMIKITYPVGQRLFRTRNFWFSRHSECIYQRKIYDARTRNHAYTFFGRKLAVFLFFSDHRTRGRHVHTHVVVRPFRGNDVIRTENIKEKK